MEGGWLNPNTIDAYLEYADVVFRYFGSRVNLWLTFNEPNTFIRQGYSEGNHAPGRCSDRSRCAEGDSFTEPYLVAHNVLRAHARAVSLFRELSETDGGAIGITLNGEWAEQTEGPDSTAPQRYMEGQIGWFADPIKFGEYPASMRSALADRLPTFSVAESELLIDSWDFFGFNFYNSLYVTDGDPSNSELPFWEQDLSLSSSGTDLDGHQIGLQGESPWLYESPGGLRNILLWINHRYLEGRLPLYITENGCSVPGESEMTYPDVLDDQWRVAYFFEYLEAMTEAVYDGVPVQGYFAWSLLDNFEWADGFQMRFGIHYVDYTVPERTRSQKASAKWYGALLNTLSQLSKEESAEENTGVIKLSASGSLVVLVLLCCVVFGFMKNSMTKVDGGTKVTIEHEIELRSTFRSHHSKYTPLK